MSEPRSHPDAPARIRLVATSASEAVAHIKKRFGEQAKVVSVNQLKADGLKRYFSKPKLEIVVEAPRSLLENAKRPASAAPQSGADASSAKKDSGQTQNADTHCAATPSRGPSSERAESVGSEPAASETAERPIRSGESIGYFDAFDSDRKSVSSGSLGAAANPVRRGRLEAAKRAVSMLQAAGFDPSLVERIRFEIDLDALGQQPAAELYRRISHWLRSQFPDEPARLSGRRRAFVGSCGSGKTSALCKAVSADVFVHGKEAAVLKLDGETPNPSDGLEAFCQILGVPLFRSSDELEGLADDCPVYVDLPGFDLSDNCAVEECRQLLDTESIDERVLVANAAYDSEILADAFAAAARLGANRFALTHLDEARRVGKLWKYLLNARFQPLFFSHGPNPAGDYAVETYSYLLRRTFPGSEAGAPASSRPARDFQEASPR